MFFFFFLTQPIAVRLVGGSNYNEGRVEVFFNNIWGTVCNRGWDAADAVVVCRQLGLSYVNAQAVSGDLFGPGSGQVWQDDVRCVGSEKNLIECNRIIWANHYFFGIRFEDAGVICFNGKK